MKVYISYFYKVRFMNKKLLPVSTAKWDPDWYHYKPNSLRKRIKNYGTYTDKNMVLNGSRIENLVFPEELFNNIPKDMQCSTNCLKNGNCKFMEEYEKYLSGLNFKDVMFYLQLLVDSYKYTYNIKENVDIVLLVHEPSSCKCGERPILKKWFKQHGITLHEWQQPCRKD